MKRYSMFIDGDWVNPSSERWLDSVNSYSGEKWAEIPLGNKEDVDRAVQAAETAMGRENGMDAIFDYLQVKSVWIYTCGPAANPYIRR